MVFDHPEPTFRHTMYVGYQTNREKDRQISEDIWGQVEKLKIVFEKMGVPVFAVPGFEADDVIGTLAGQSAGEAVIITGDRDLMQLVNDHVNLYMPQKGLSDGVLIDGEKVKEKLGVRPDQVVDYKALVGDSSDNYPGINGIGPKTAVSLLEEYATFEEIIAQIPNPKSQMPIKLKEKIANGYEGGVLSKQLAQIRTDAPVTLETENCLVPGEEKIVEVLKELGYKSLIKRITGQDMVMDDKQGKLFE